MASRWRTVALVAAAVVVGLIVRLATYTGTIASDDLTHAWAAQHVWHDPVEHSMPDQLGSPYTVNARRVGVNLPLAAAVAIAGPREGAFAAVPLIASLLGIGLIALAALGVGGPRAAVLAAWLTAVLPIDVWQATIWLQDSLFAAGLAGVLAALMWAQRHPQGPAPDRRATSAPAGGAERRDRWWLWLVAGATLGYLQYVKESAAIVLVALVALGAWRSWHGRALHRGTVWLLVGFAALQVLATVYFAIAFDDVSYYLRAWLGRQVGFEGEAAPRPFPHNLVRLGLYLTWSCALGIGLPVALIPGGRWLARRAPPSTRLTLAVLLVVQLAITVHVLRWGAWTMRYLLQVTPILVLVAAAGLAEVWRERSARARAGLYAAVITATAAGLVVGHPQHGRFRGELVREVGAVIARDVPGDAPVYVVLGPRPARAVGGPGQAHYVDRALALLDGPRPGGWHVTGAPTTIARGVLIYSNLERHLAPPSPAPGRLLYQGQTRGGKDWLVAYAVGFPAGWGAP